jgi:hypothetical protein
MNAVAATIRRLGPAGARDNAFRACEEHRLALLRIDALGRHLAQGSPGAPGTSTSTTRPSAEPEQQRRSA